MKVKSEELLNSFVQYCTEHPELRFWQALSNWSGGNRIYIERYNEEVDDMLIEDTYYM